MDIMALIYFMWTVEVLFVETIGCLNDFKELFKKLGKRFWTIFRYIGCMKADRPYEIMVIEYPNSGPHRPNDFKDSFLHTLTHWGRVTQICVRKVTIIGSDNGLSPGRRQAIIWTNAGISVIGTLGTNFSQICIEIHTFSLKKMSSGKW